MHWALAELMTLDHAERLRWVEEVSSQLDAADDAASPGLRYG